MDAKKLEGVSGGGLQVCGSCREQNGARVLLHYNTGGDPEQDMAVLKAVAMTAGIPEDKAVAQFERKVAALGGAAGIIELYHDFRAPLAMSDPSGVERGEWIQPPAAVF
jgi:hypothetical protein